MAQLYREVSRELACRIRLVIADVDGTLTANESIEPPASEVATHLEQNGISLGFASGRTMPRLEPLALALGISGPIIAENGGIAKLHVKQALVDLGYRRESALKAFQRLRQLFPEAIEELPDNKDRLVDVSFSSHGVDPEEIRTHLDNVQLLDSGYMLHLLPPGISKGNTLKILLTTYYIRLSKKSSHRQSSATKWGIISNKKDFLWEATV